MMRKNLIASAIMAASMGAYGSREILKPKNEDDQIDIIAEYELIMQKKSKLSANKRRWVIAQFNKL